MPVVTPPRRIVARPELLEAEPLPLVRPARKRVWVALVIVGLVALTGMITGQADWTLALVLLTVWAGYALLVLSDQRAFLQASAGQLRVRNVLRTHFVRGEQVRRVVHQYNGKRPDFTLKTDRGTVWVPTSKLERGHSTLFTWLDVHAPQAELDRQSAHWRQVLLDDGQI